MSIPNMERMGLGKIKDLEGISSTIKARGAYGKMAESSAGKDTTTGHWEIAGIILKEPFPTYPDGFPPEVIKPFEREIGREVLGNKPASGTKIIEELGEEHIKTGKPIVYTSADSVFQIAAHEEVIPVEELYNMCKIARRILTGKHAVGRVIARPFIGKPGNFVRTERREDFSLEPPEKTMLDIIKEAGLQVYAVGKIVDIFAGRGINEYNHTVDNMDSVDAILDYMDEVSSGLIFANLVEFDMVYGHRRNVKGYARALEEFDQRIPEILDKLKSNDILIITADHGCDPAYKGTDHTREYVPLLIYGENIKEDCNLGVRSSYSDLAATITDLLGVRQVNNGESFAGIILK
ncbi:phosphopentomutase [Halothermothrix orenii H 168]|uniref:Phosphopentomutase n=1 Tax=Halothermothrix orenii (strain H 168 / OCM 544 / DSM 9562) TaxID=373903 RepID=B8CVY3_HALOH|nr:phosphopentomutase [Halothermothrix orenii H 168]